MNLNLNLNLNLMKPRENFNLKEAMHVEINQVEYN